MATRPRSIMGITSGISKLVAYILPAFVAGVYAARRGMFGERELISKNREILVLGTARVESEPDMAVVRLGFRHPADQAKVATDTLNEQIAGLFEALARIEITAQDIRTTQISLREERRRTKSSGKASNGAPERFEIQFIAESQLEIKVRNLDELGKVLDTASEEGVTQIEGVRFEVQDTRPLLERARRLAVIDGRRQAESMAQCAGLRLGATLQICSNVQGMEPVHHQLSQAISYSASIAPGELIFEEQVRMRFELITI